MSVPLDTKVNIEQQDSLKDSKTTLRRSLLTLRLSLENDQRQLWDKQICHYVEHYIEKHQIKSLGVYFAIRNEPELTQLYQSLASKDITLSLPIVISQNAPLQFAKWQPGDLLIKENYGIPVPKQKEIVPIPNAVLVPCLGFSQNRYRLGYGGGYFDRTLEQKPRPHTIGIAYSCLQIDFPVQQYDIPMDCIITEKNIF